MEESPDYANKPTRIKREEALSAPGLVADEIGATRTAASSAAAASLATRVPQQQRLPGSRGESAPRAPATLPSETTQESEGQSNENSCSRIFRPYHKSLTLPMVVDTRSLTPRSESGKDTGRFSTKRTCIGSTHADKDPLDAFGIKISAAAVIDASNKISTVSTEHRRTQTYGLDLGEPQNDTNSAKEVPRCESLAKNNPMTMMHTAIQPLVVPNGGDASDPANAALHERAQVETPQLQAERETKPQHMLNLSFAPPMPDVSTMLEQACQMLGRYVEGGAAETMICEEEATTPRSDSRCEDPSKSNPNSTSDSLHTCSPRSLDLQEGETPGRGRSRGRLSLSEYRKPEPSVRLTDAQPTRRLSDFYDLRSSQCRVLGHGASSTVRLAVRRSDGRFVAIKSIGKCDVLFSRRGGRLNSHRRRKLDECEILKSLADVPNVVGLLDYFEDEDEVQLVTEYCAGGELFDAIHRKRQAMKRHAAATGGSPCRGSGYSEYQAARIISQLLGALSHLHARGIVHRDVKPENVLLVSADEDETRVKLSDFGLARALHHHHHRHQHPEKRQPESAYDEPSSSGSESESSSSSGEDSPITPPSVLRARAYSTVGSNFYVAPEVEAGAGYDTQCDVYSLGVTLYILLCGFPPSSGRSANGYDEMDFSSSDESEDEEMQFPASGAADLGAGPDVEFPGTHWKTVSDEAKHLVRCMLHRDPAVRITADSALEHPWIVQNLKDCHDYDDDSDTAKENLEFHNDRVYGNRKKRASISQDGPDEVPGDKSRIRRRLSPPVDPAPPAPNMAVTQHLPPLATMAYGHSVAFSMAELCSRITGVAEAASAAAAGYGSDEDDAMEQQQQETTASMTALSV